MAHIAVESSLKMFFKVMKMKKPETLYSMIASDEDEVKSLSDKELEKLTKLSRKSWRIRVLRYSKIVPATFFHEDPFSLSFKGSLKSWYSYLPLVESNS